MPWQRRELNSEELETNQDLDVRGLAAEDGRGRRSRTNPIQNRNVFLDFLMVTMADPVPAECQFDAKKKRRHWE